MTTTARLDEPDLGVPERLSYRCKRLVLGPPLVNARLREE